LVGVGVGVKVAVGGTGVGVKVAVGGTGVGVKVFVGVGVGVKVAVGGTGVGVKVFVGVGVGVKVAVGGTGVGVTPLNTSADTDTASGSASPLYLPDQTLPDVAMVSVPTAMALNETIARGKGDSPPEVQGPPKLRQSAFA